jgi:hypothetical protein
MWVRNSKNLVVASDNHPAVFRPGNQARLVPARSANPSPSQPSDFMPGMGAVQSGNGISSNGLASGAADARFQSLLLNARQRQAQMLAGGSPNAPARPVMTMSIAQSLAALPSAPGSGALQIDLAWAGDSIAAERAEIIRMYQLKPAKPFGKIQTYVSYYWGTDADAAKTELARQPIVSVANVRLWEPRQPVTPRAPEYPWKFVQGIKRPDGSRWIITTATTPTGTRFAAALYRSKGESDDEIVRTDNLATADAAREYIRAYEVKAGNLAQDGRPKRTVYWNSGLKTPYAGAQNATTRASMNGFTLKGMGTYVDASAYQGVNGLLGSLGSLAASPLILGGLAIGALFFLNKAKG